MWFLCVVSEKVTLSHLSLPYGHSQPIIIAIVAAAAIIEAEARDFRVFTLCQMLYEFSPTTVSCR